MKSKASTPAKRSIALVSTSPRPRISRRDLRVANRIAQAFGCLPVLPAKSPRN